jgi:hypothetical protein
VTPRRINALLCALGAGLIAWGVLSTTWWFARIDVAELVLDLKLGLVSVTGCTHDPAGVWRCETVDWSKLGVTADSALWVWSGRLLFGVAIAAAVGFALTAVLAAVPVETSLPVSPTRVGLAFAGVAVVLVGLYRVSTPEGVTVLLDAGRSWWLTLGGLGLGGAGAVRELRAAAS